MSVQILNIYEIYYAYDHLGICRYIGIGKPGRHRHVNSGRSHNPLLNNYVMNGNKFKVVAIERFCTRKDILTMEEVIISYTGRVVSNTGPLWNITSGGDGVDSQTAKKTMNKRIKEGYIPFEHENDKKWNNTSADQRKVMTSHLHTNEIYQKRSRTMLEVWGVMDSENRKHRLTPLINFTQTNKHKEQARRNGVKSFEVLASVICIESPDGIQFCWRGVKQFRQYFGVDAYNILHRTRHGSSYQGWKAYYLDPEGIPVRETKKGNMRRLKNTAPSTYKLQEYINGLI